MKISESTEDRAVGTYPKPIAFPSDGDIVPEVTIPITFPFASAIS